MSNIEKFKALPIEKQEKIMDAGLRCFGKLGYKKASTSDIAKMAGISKGMIFHYFGTKKEMYFTLIQLACDRIVPEINAMSENLPTDFFDRAIVLSRRKVEILKKYPSLMPFFTSIFKETDKEVEEGLKKTLGKGDFVRSELMLTDIDIEKFRTTVKPELILELLVGYSMGVVTKAQLGTSKKIDALLDNITECITMLKNNFYKEEYL